MKQLQDFLNKNKIKISKYAMSMCEEGVFRMTNNPDPHHSKAHVLGLLKELEKLIKNEGSLNKKNINFDVLLTSICWHDVWIGSCEQTDRLSVFIYKHLWEGAKSKDLFLQYAKNIKLPKKFVDDVAYCVLKHSRWSQYLPKTIQKILFQLKIVEAKILCDIDTLDMWSNRRFNLLINSYFKSKQYTLKPKHIRIAKFWFLNSMQYASAKNFYFEYSIREFQKRKMTILKRCLKLWDQKHLYIDIEDPEISKYLEFDTNQLIPELREVK